MVDLPLKSVLLKQFKEEPEQWDYEAIAVLLKKYGIDRPYWRLTARLWMAEMATCGLMDVVEQDIDDGTHFGEGKVLTKYRLTPLGTQRIETMLE
jgi:hypothetical protein